MKKSLLKLNYILILAALIIIGVAHQSSAGTVAWSQTPDLSASGDAVDAYYGFNPSISFQMVADDWMCTDGSQDIIGINWWGSYNGYSDDASLLSSVVSSFQVFILPDDNGQPGTPAKKSFSATTVTETYVGQNQGTGDSVFKYSVSVPDQFNQVEGTTYWLALYAVMQPATAYTWGWNTSSDAWGNTCMTTNDFANWNEEYFGSAPINLAFELIKEGGEEIPEPGTIALLCSLATGLFSVFGIRKRSS
jgi:hypothetical protein